MTLILCGLPGCGKSFFGERVAKQLGCSFIDTDVEIEKLYNTGRTSYSCREIVRREGEVYFRALEKEVIQSLSSEAAAVVALGGGSLLDSVNTRHLTLMGKLVYLEGSLEWIFSRTVQNGIPTYLDKDHPWESFQKLAAVRIPIYERAAHLVVNIERNKEHQVLSEIATVGRQHGK